MRLRYPSPPPPGYRWVFTPYYRHHRMRQLVYPKKARFFCFLVKD